MCVSQRAARLWTGPVTVVGLLAACGRVAFEPGDAREPPAPSPDADLLRVVGCADGSREALEDPGAFPTIAGCATSWPGALDLRSPATGAACGDDLAACASPSDACARGWHLCGIAGDPGELLVLDAATCRAPTGRFVAALSHVDTFAPCVYAVPGSWRCTGFSPVCCGSGCSTPGCPDGIWSGQTREPAGSGCPCDALPGTMLDGVLCCAD